VGSCKAQGAASQLFMLQGADWVALPMLLERLACKPESGPCTCPVTVCTCELPENTMCLVLQPENLNCLTCAAQA
jgi:hypothetical protein